jgi:hypothetical protein
MPGVYWTAVGPMPRQPEAVLDAQSRARDAGLAGRALPEVTAGTTTPVFGGLVHWVMWHVTVDVLEHVIRHVRRILIDWPIRHVRRHVLKIKAPIGARRQQGGGGGSGP